jgi:hypothetical protein
VLASFWLGRRSGGGSPTIFKKKKNPITLEQNICTNTVVGDSWSKTFVQMQLYFINPPMELGASDQSHTKGNRFVYTKMIPK